MKNPVVLISGALTGIGRATAVAFAKQGAKLVVSGRREELGKELVAELAKFDAEAIFVRADVRREDDVRNLVEQAVSRFSRLDIAVNNAGTEGTMGPIVEQSAESYAAIFDTNVLGVLLSMKHELLAMQKQKSGSIVNISSVAGHVGFPGAGVYTASKHAVEGLTKTAALEFAEHGIRVNAVAPGPIETPMINRFTGGGEGKAGLAAMIPSKRIGTAEEVAEAIVFTASDKSKYLTGVSLPVDGGLLAS